MSALVLVDDGPVAAHLLVALELLRRWLREQGERGGLPPELEALDAALRSTRTATSRQGPTTVDGSGEVNDGAPVDPILLSFGQAARLLGCSKRTVERRVDDGSIPVVDLGGRTVRIHRDDLEEFAQRRRQHRFPAPAPTHPATVPSGAHFKTEDGAT